MPFIEPDLFRQGVEAALAGRKAIRQGDELLSVWSISIDTQGWHQPMPDDLCRALFLRQRSTYSDGGKRLIKILLGKK
jgi:hypothetical protein